MTPLGSGWIMGAHRWPLAVLALTGLLQGCLTSPKQTVLNLDTTDRKWTSKTCVEARQEAAQYKDHTAARLALGVGGNLIVPFAGTGAVSTAPSGAAHAAAPRAQHQP
jgi:hypothetical protein